MLNQPRPLVPFTFPFAGQSYEGRILNTQKANLIALWDLGDTTGSTALNAEGTTARNGTYTNGVTLNAAAFSDGTPAPSFDGTDDYVNVFSSSLQSAFNSGEGSIMLWALHDATFWTDGVTRGLINFQADSSNTLRIFKNSSNQLALRYIAGGTQKQVVPAGTPTTWTHYLLTWSKSADQLKAYINGAQVGLTQTGLGMWTGSLASNTVTVGALSTTPSNPSRGLYKYAALWSAPLSAAEAAALGTV